uniref:DUF4381 domain-containing protein n=1 Tax=uncultured Thiotrichaceae bacterium TaxID=298394 RepID=A0A6S6SNW5_9GAMM|nr:MAG: Unknown protein [uncultured Thiotrichaceae bacterium]
MNPEELPLRDIHLPVEISVWPPAFGWWLLLALIILLLVAAFKWWSGRTPVYRKQVVQPALRELQRIETDYANDPNEMIRQLSILLRRSAISFHGRHRVAGLTGMDWLTFLDDKQHGQVFSTRFADILTQQPYREQVQGDAASLVTVVRDWLQQQETPDV